MHKIFLRFEESSAMNKKYLQNIVFTGLLLFVYFWNSSAQFSFSQGTANTANNGTKNVRLLNEVNSKAALGIYGGNLKSGTDATGFFPYKKSKRILVYC